MSEGFTESVTIGGETYDFNPKKKQIIVHCDNCMHPNEVDVEREGDSWMWYSFSCENCGHFNTRE